MPGHVGELPGLAHAFRDDLHGTACDVHADDVVCPGRRAVCVVGLFPVTERDARVELAARCDDDAVEAAEAPRGRPDNTRVREFRAVPATPGENLMAAAQVHGVAGRRQAEDAPGRAGKLDRLAAPKHVDTAGDLRVSLVTEAGDKRVAAEESEHRRRGHASREHRDFVSIRSLRGGRRAVRSESRRRPRQRSRDSDRQRNDLDPHVHPPHTRSPPAGG